MIQYFRNRRFIYYSAGLIILLIFITGIIIALSAARGELERLRSQHNEMVLLKDEFLSLKTRIDTIERKKNLMKINGVIPAVDEVFSSLGLKNRIKSIKPSGTKEMSGSIEEEAEVLAEKLSMNEMVNLFYKIENAPMLLVLKKVNIKTSFEKPDLLNLTIVISLVHEK